MIQLLCIFTTKDKLDKTVNDIKEVYTILFDKIFVLSMQDTDELICTFNINKEVNKRILPNVMSIHRKKETNTLYTINSINLLNGGKHIPVQWENYKNAIILQSNNTVKVINTKIFSIISL